MDETLGPARSACCNDPVNPRLIPDKHPHQERLRGCVHSGTNPASPALTRMWASEPLQNDSDVRRFVLTRASPTTGDLNRVPGRSQQTAPLEGITRYRVSSDI